MVQHAADEQQPLLAAEERITQAFTAVTGGKSFTEEQERWLERIRQHVIENLSLDREDFNTIPVLEQAGGWGRANRVFQGGLLDLVQELNRAIVA